ncbi:MAG: hypothetical protein IKL80_05700 [Clostridia bacterium]|nr:hypothetical protein [Clostridia bacterium]
MTQQYLYIVFSATPYKIGKLIRRFTGEEFNHVSLSLDKNCTKMYSFARRYYRHPFYGGFVRESPARFNPNGLKTKVCICALPVTEAQYHTLTNLLQAMEKKQAHYLYNHLSTIGAVIHKPIPVADAYTCVEFCIKILNSLGVDVNPKQYYSVGNLQKCLASYVVYRGTMPPGTAEDNAYFGKPPVPHPRYAAMRDICKLFFRSHAAKNTP